MILTLTLNPAIDRNISADRLVFEDRAYILSTHQSAGGRGINASRLIHSFGGQTQAVLPLGGPAGKTLKTLLGSAGFPIEVVPIEHETRTNLTITDKQGLTIELNELGAPLSARELQAVEQTVERLLPQAEWLMLCGSLPPGVRADFYPRLIEKANAQNVKTLLDTDNEALLEGVEAGPTVVTPNQHEAERLLNRALITRGQFLDAAERIRHMGAQHVILSLGSRGAVVCCDDRLQEVRPPQIDAVSPIGSSTLR